jgi:transcriptional regulator with XRE-family HTH domain
MHQTTDLHDVMPKRRPMELLRRLGRRIRARRKHLKRTRAIVARGAEISIPQLVLYESGQGHPPAFTLHRIARALGTTSSALLGENMHDNAEQVDAMMKSYADPSIGAILRYMPDITKEDRKSLQVIAAAFANRSKPLETIEVMQ